MKIILMSFVTFVYGVCASVYEYRFNALITEKVRAGKPLVDKKLVKMSERCYEGRCKFEKMEKSLKLEIAKRADM